MLYEAQACCGLPVDPRPSGDTKIIAPNAMIRCARLVTSVHGGRSQLSPPCSLNHPGSRVETDRMIALQAVVY
eukprot:350500-Chlamydomonas_euryale.AAC.6